MDILEVIETAKANRGGTFYATRQPNGSFTFEVPSHVNGYYVAECGGYVYSTPDNIPHGIIDMLEDSPTGYIGLWEHEGEWYLDRSHWYMLEDAAHRYARAEGQLAFWDIAAGKEVTT